MGPWSSRIQPRGKVLEGAACAACRCGRSTELLETLLLSRWESWDKSDGAQHRSHEWCGAQVVVTVLVKFSGKSNWFNWAMKHGVCNFGCGVGRWNKIYKARRLQMGKKCLLKIWCEEMGQPSPPGACGRGSWNTSFQTEYLHLSPKRCHVHSDVQGKTCWILDKDKAIRGWSNCNAKCLFFVFCLFIAFCLKSSWSLTC